MKRRRLEVSQLRKILDNLYDGEQAVLMPLLQCRNFKQEHEIYVWLYRNGIKGKKLVEFFQNESNALDGTGYLNGINKIIQKIQAEKNKILNVRDLI